MFYLRLFLLILIMCSLVRINTQGLQSPNRRQANFRFLQCHKYDILVQETHWTDDLYATLQCEWSGDIYYSNRTNSSRGVATLKK